MCIYTSKKKGVFVSNWKEELNDFLASHGAVFSDQSWDEFRQEMRYNISRIHVPLFTAILLNDGIGSAALRIGTIVDCIVMFFAFYSERYSGAKILLMLIVSAVICIPGFWIWHYRLMAPKERMARMLALFRRKVAEQEQCPPRD